MEWRKSSRSNSDGACVEFRQVAAAVQIRDSKDKTGPTLEITLGEWSNFVDGVKGGQFDL